MRKRMAVVPLALAALTAAGAVSLRAQVAPGARWGPGPHMGRSVEVALEHQQELQLTGEQVRALEQLKGSLDRDVNPLLEEIQGLRERIRAGEVDRQEGLRQTQALRGRLLTVSAPLLGGVQEILTVEQHRKLQSLVFSERPGAWGGMGFRQGFPGRAPVPAPGFRAPMGRRGMMMRPGTGFRFHQRPWGWRFQDPGLLPPEGF